MIIEINTKDVQTIFTASRLVQYLIDLHIVDAKLLVYENEPSDVFDSGTSVVFEIFSNKIDEAEKWPTVCLDFFATGLRTFIRTVPEISTDRDIMTDKTTHKGYVRFFVMTEKGEWIYPQSENEVRIQSLGLAELK